MKMDAEIAMYYICVALMVVFVVQQALMTDWAYLIDALGEGVIYRFLAIFAFTIAAGALIGGGSGGKDSRGSSDGVVNSVAVDWRSAEKEVV